MKDRGVVIDWRAYWADFRRAHGDPVPFKGRLLFQDGWTYSATDHRGPEWPPPSEPVELEKLQLVWWSLRRGKLKELLIEARERTDQVRQMVLLREVPLQRRVIIKDDQGKRSAQSVLLRVEDMDDQCQWLAADLQAAEEAIEAIHEQRRQRHQRQQATPALAG